MSNELRELIAETQRTFREDPGAARATFESRSALQDGLRTEARLREHVLTVDEPESLGGTDTGPNPVELILAARNLPADGPDDPRDLNGDGQISVRDARGAAIRCSRPRCATE